MPFSKRGHPQIQKGPLRERRGRKGPVPKTGHYDFQNRPNGLETGQCRKTYEQKIVERFGGQQELDLVIPLPFPRRRKCPNNLHFSGATNSCCDWPNPLRGAMRMTRPPTEPASIRMLVCV